MKAKAKRLDNGEWVEGYYVTWKHFNGKKHIDIHVIDNTTSLGSDKGQFEIDPKTLCQQVRGTELFEGDEVKLWHDAINDWIIGNIQYGDFMWDVITQNDGLYSFHYEWKPTGKNIND